MLYFILFPEKVLLQLCSNQTKDILTFSWTMSVVKVDQSKVLALAQSQRTDMSPVALSGIKMLTWRNLCLAVVPLSRWKFEGMDQDLEAEGFLAFLDSAMRVWENGGQETRQDIMPNILFASVMRWKVKV